MKTLTDDEVNTLINALDAAANRYRDHAREAREMGKDRTFTALHATRLAQQFERRVAEVVALRDAITEVGSVALCVAREEEAA